MDFEKKYKVALERARALHAEAIAKGYPRDYVKEYEAVFPELAESYDDIIRKELVEAFAVYGNDSFWKGIPIKSILAWLKKHKPVDTTEIAHCINCPVYEKAEWSEEDERILKGIIGLIDHNQHYGVGNKEMLAWLNNLRPQQKEQKPMAWSKKQDDIIGYIRHILNDHAFEHNGLDVNGDYCTDEYVQADDFLKSLRPQTKWKPSEEQMNALEHVLEMVEEEWGYEEIELRSLIADLKKLKEE